MAPGHDEQMDKRRERREEQRRRQQAEQRRLKIALVAAVLVFIACGVGIWYIAKNAENLSSAQISAQNGAPATKPTEAPKETSPLEASNSVTTINIRAAGDLNITDAVIKSGLAASGYDFTRAFIDVSSSLSDADLTLMNFEGNICGEPYGTLRTSAPAEILEALRHCGVDMLQVANSCTINNGLIGLTSTLSAIRSAGMTPLGAYANAQEFQQSKGYTICDIQGIKVAIVAFTKGVGGMGLPAGNEDCVNLLYTDYATTYDEVDKAGINAILKSIEAEKPDITIAMLHWGSEYNETVSSTQRSIVSLMQKGGVDIIIGTHPHLVQEISYDPMANTLVAYSLGDFFGDGTRGGTNYSIILDIEITKDTAAGTTRVTGYDYIPIYTLKGDQSLGDYNYSRVVRIEETMLAYNTNFVDKVLSGTFSDLEYSMTRIEARTNPPKTEE